VPGCLSSLGTGCSRGSSHPRQPGPEVSFPLAYRVKHVDPDPTQSSAYERGERLAGLIRQHRTLLILDGIKPLQYPPNDPQARRLKDPALEWLLLMKTKTSATTTK
jgi:hypothetical protein